MVVLRLDDVYTGARDSASFCVYSKSFIVQSLKREKQQKEKEEVRGWRRKQEMEK